MLQQRTNRSQAWVKAVAALRTWGLSVMVPQDTTISRLRQGLRESAKHSGGGEALSHELGV